MIAVNLDVRGFSRFSLEVDAVDTALYIRKVYERVLTDYFTDASFFKPTGDGLLLVFELDETDSPALLARATSVVTTGLRLVDEFSTLLENDEWVYFAVPQHLGIGISRGAASRLAAEDVTLDYSGSVLNAASRLMDLARPSGLVLDRTFPFQLLGTDIQERFAQDDAIYVRSIAEKLPTRIYYQKDLVELPASTRRPFDAVEWEEVRRSMTVKQMRDSGSFLVDLPARPLDVSRIVARVDYPATTPAGVKRPGMLNEYTVPKSYVAYDDDAGENRLRLNYRAISQALTKGRAKDGWQVTLVIRFPV